MLWSFHFLLSRVAVLAWVRLQHQSWIMCGNTAQGDKFDLLKWCLFWSLRDLRQDKWLLDRRFRSICVRGLVVTNPCVQSGKVWITLTLPAFFDPPLLLKRHCAFKFKWLCRLQEERGREQKKWRMVYEQEGGGKKAELEGVKREDLACFRQEVGGDSEKNLRKAVSPSPQSPSNFVSLLPHPPFRSSESILQASSVRSHRPLY